MKKCTTCGRTFDDEANFCTRDGTRLVERISRSRTPNPGLETAVNLVGKTLQHRYHIEEKVGEGGMSFVYRATDKARGERCAIKVLSAALSKDENAMARLKREASMGMRLVHPNICHIVRLGETDDGLVYVVMPYLEGEILSDRTNRMHQIPLAQAVPIVHDVAVGLDVAHDLAIIHRDLKPENVMVCGAADGSEHAVVMDFGLAKERRAGAELEKLTATGIILGTPEFMSPEQLRGQALDRRSDLYSLALMTYEMLTGKLPFQGSTQQEIMLARLRGDPLTLDTMRPDLRFPDQVERVLRTGLSRSRDERYQTTIQFAEELAIAAGVETPRGDAGAGNGDGDAADGLLGKLFGH
jgi:serine/threonine protein kinase